MKIVAKLQTEEATDLFASLKNAGVPAEVKSFVADGGLEMSELSVDDSFYAHACDVADAWQTQRLADAKAQCQWSCPRCKSRSLECVSNDKIEFVFRCKDCGEKFIPCGPPAGSFVSRSTSQTKHDFVPSNENMRFTLFIVSLTVTIWIVGWLITHITQRIYPASFWAYFLSSIVCLERGRYIRKNNQTLGWLCIVLGAIPLIIVLVAIFLNRVRVHS